MKQEMSAPKVTRAPSDMVWPGGRNVAVVFNVAYETWSDGNVSGVGPMGNPLPAGVFDVNADSYGNYGANCGIQRLLRVLGRTKVAANIYVSGRLAERSPDQVKRVAEAGHEIVGHGYAQDLIPAKLTPEDDAKYIERTTELLTSVIGAKPTGWISPRATANNETFRRLVKAGYKWHGDVLDTDLPYIQEFEEGSITAVPLSIDLNDLAHAMRFGRTPRQFIEIFDDFLYHALANRDEAIIIDVLVHTHCYGRPGGAWAYEEIARKCAQRDDVWVTTRGKISEHLLSQLK